MSHPELMGAEYTDTDVHIEEGHQGFVQYTVLDWTLNITAASIRWLSV